MGRQTKFNLITSGDLLMQVNTENMELLRDFESYLRSVQRSETTIHGYDSDIKIAWVWCLQNNGNKRFTDWTKRNIVSYQNWLLENNENSPARVRRLKSSLSSLSNYIEAVLDDEYPDFRNIINKIEDPAINPVREKTVWTEEELQKLLDTLTAQKMYEKACFLALAMYSGRRKAELFRFKVDDFSEERLVCGGALYKSAPIRTKGRGGGKIIPCYTLAKKFKPYLRRWLEERSAEEIDSEWLFPRRGNGSEHITITTVNSWARTFSRLSGKDAYIHSFRHYFTTSLAKAGLPDSVIQSIVSWESGDMVRLYKDIDADEEIGMYFRDGEIVRKDRMDIANL